MKFLDIIIDAKEMEIKLTKKKIWNVWQNNVIHGQDIYDQLYDLKKINNKLQPEHYVHGKPYLTSTNHQNNHLDD